MLVLNKKEGEGNVVEIPLMCSQFWNGSWKLPASMLSEIHCLNFSVCKWWPTDGHTNVERTLYAAAPLGKSAQIDPPVTQSHVAWIISRVSAWVRNVTSWAIYVTT